jgi:hypothetical protein
MGLPEWLKNTIDWARRVEFVYRMGALLWAFTVGATARAYLKSFTRLPNVWHLPLYLFASCLALLLFGLVAHRMTGKPNVSDSETSEIIRGVKMEGARSILLSFFGARATDLQTQLEALWHHWNNEGERLIHPLDMRIDKLNSNSSDVFMKLINEHREFLVLYSHHINTLRVELPEFTSPVMTAGYPSDCEYHQAMTNLRAHAEKLKTESEEAWKKY